MGLSTDTEKKRAKAREISRVKNALIRAYAAAQLSGELYEKGTTISINDQKFFANLEKMIADHLYKGSSREYWFREVLELTMDSLAEAAKKYASVHTDKKRLGSDIMAILVKRNFAIYSYLNARADSNTQLEDIASSLTEAIIKRAIGGNTAKEVASDALRIAFSEVGIATQRKLLKKPLSTFLASEANFSLDRVVENIIILFGSSESVAGQAGQLIRDDWNKQRNR